MNEKMYDNFAKLYDIIKATEKLEKPYNNKNNTRWAGLEEIQT